MEDVELTKDFAFSASYSSGARAVGRNFVLSITVSALDERHEAEFEATVHRELVSKLHTRDLSEQVDFMKNVEMSDAGLLRAFWARLEGPLRPYGPKRLTLRRDPRTAATLHL